MPEMSEIANVTNGPFARKLAYYQQHIANLYCCCVVFINFRNFLCDGQLFKTHCAPGLSAFLRQNYVLTDSYCHLSRAQVDSRYHPASASVLLSKLITTEPTRSADSCCRRNTEFLRFLSFNKDRM